MCIGTFAVQLKSYVENDRAGRDVRAVDAKGKL